MGIVIHATEKIKEGVMSVCEYFTHHYQDDPAMQTGEGEGF